jgi:hypothetical protein
MTQPTSTSTIWKFVRNGAIGAVIAYVALTLFVPPALPSCDSDIAKSEMVRAINEGPYSRRSGVKALRVIEVEEVSYDSEEEVRVCTALISRNDARDRRYRVELIKVGESAMEVTMEAM